uniref:X8 domain-containing protein n=1 Tax=Quercus lobata TaxID=97700 RepID=A0A7N2KYX0_QUELO
MSPKKQNGKNDFLVSSPSSAKIFLFLVLTLPLLAGALVSEAQTSFVGKELWCVAKNNTEDTALQTALDWACEPGADDCSSIQQGGP